MNHRLFIAINLPAEIKNQLAKLVEKLKKENRHLNIKWMEKENIHLTLHFLGYLEEEQIKKVNDLISQSIIGIAPAELELKELDGFPNLNYPRIIFVSAQELNGATIFALQKKLGQGLEKIGIEVDNRVWQIHLTLGRNKGTGKLNLVKENVSGLKFKVESVELMESKLDKTGPSYSVVKSYKLKK